MSEPVYIVPLDGNGDLREAYGGWVDVDEDEYPDPDLYPELWTY